MKHVTLILILAATAACARFHTTGPGKDGAPGANGTNGINGVDGLNGANGSSCAVVQTEEGALITCGDTAVVITNGKNPPEPTFLCHIPPGNPDRARALYVPATALEAHLGHGDYLGECQ